MQVFRILQTLPRYGLRTLLQVLLGSPHVTGLLELDNGSRAPTAKGAAQRVVNGLMDGAALACVTEDNALRDPSLLNVRVPTARIISAA